MEPEATAFVIEMLNSSAGVMSAAATSTTIVAVAVPATSARTKRIASGCSPSPAGSGPRQAPRARSDTSAGPETRI